uniref:Protein kinase domain-containing protein n=1 Tax=Caenorhabditis tropicalis TaxID=1561998 RepID=A0A1I7TH05_9PELO
MSKDEGGATVSPAAAPASGSTEKAEEIVFNIGDVINGYKIVKKIDEGGFGQVFKVTKDEKTFYAMKLELNSQEGGSAIKLEIHVLSQLPKNSVFPGMICGGRKTKFSYLVLELLGDSLKTLKTRCPNPECLSDGTWSRIGIQCLFAFVFLKSLRIP